MELSPYLQIFDHNQIPSLLSDEERCYTFPYKLDNFQEAGIYGIQNNENVLITAHTGSGKTVLAIYGIAYAIKNNKKVIYTSPTKSLSNQKYDEFIKLFSGISTIGIMTGDIKVNPDAQIMIMTTEILRNLLYKAKNLDGLGTSTFINMEDVAVVIFDEVHYINDPDRGRVWEEVIIMLQREIILVMLSATIDKAEQFCSWIGNIKQKKINLIKTSHRVVPLKHYFWKDIYYEDEEGKQRLRWEKIQICDNDGNFKNYDQIKQKYKKYDTTTVINKLLDHLIEDNQLPALFFRFSRKKCEEMCHSVNKNIINHEELTEILQIFDSKMRKFKPNYEKLQQYQDIYRQIQKGVAYHHSGMIPILKEIVEILFSKGLIKILFATETFAIGVNMPTKTVIFSELEKFDNKGLRPLRSDEYNQMSGRAGRRGLDKYGTVIILPTFNLMSYDALKLIMSGKSPSLKSKFQLSYQFVLKTLYNFEFKIDHYFNDTLFDLENQKMKKSDLKICDDLTEEMQNLFKNEETILEQMKLYNKIEEKLNDKVFVVNRKERQKLEKELQNIKLIKNFKIYEEKFKIYKAKEIEFQRAEDNIWYCTHGLQDSMKRMIQLLEEEKFVENNIITTKGIIASSICEVSELILSQAVYDGLFDDLEFEEIVALISSFINEKDPNNQEKYINDLKIPAKIHHKLNKLTEISEHYYKCEEKYGIYIQSDFKLYLDFIEPSYIWAQGLTIHDVYKYTNIYDGNFVKAILRINNIMMNFSDICNYLKKYELLKKIENYESYLIRDVVSINSLYIEGL
jgi:antiviral helicase SKI2